jgi:hypothetical protein
MDFAKAFDKVSHRRLLYKLEYYGIQTHTLNWIQAFLTDRTLMVSTVHLSGWKAISQSASHLAGELHQGQIVVSCSRPDMLLRNTNPYSKLDSGIFNR